MMKAASKFEATQKIQRHRSTLGDEALDYGAYGWPGAGRLQFRGTHLVLQVSSSQLRKGGDLH